MVMMDSMLLVVPHDALKHCNINYKFINAKGTASLIYRGMPAFTINSIVQQARYPLTGHWKEIP